jgi:TolC family type I secretion outer membrane protein
MQRLGWALTLILLIYTGASSIGFGPLLFVAGIHGLLQPQQSAERFRLEPTPMPTTSAFVRLPRFRWALSSILAACSLTFAVAEVTVENHTSPRIITLDQAYDIALASDQSIRIAGREIRKANLQPWSALARMGPSVTGGARYSTARTSNSQLTTLTSGGADRITVDTNTNNRSADITLQQPLFDPAVFPAYRLGKLASQAAHLQQQFTVRQTLFGVAQAYYNVLRQQSLVDVNQQTVDLAKKQLDLAQTRFDVGAVARIDVIRARATLEEQRNTLIQSKGALEVYKDVLSNILNLSGKTDFVLQEPPDAPHEATEFDTVLAQAYAGREDLKVSEIAVRQEETRRAEIRAEYLPRVVAQASTQWGDKPGNGSEPRSRVNDALVAVQMPFLTGGQREISLLAAGEQIAQARLNLEKTHKSIEGDVKNSWIKATTARDSIKALEAEVEAAQQNYADLQAQYEAGTATSLDVQSALRDLNNARTLLTSQRYEYQIALRDLARAQATFEKERVASTRCR